MTYISYWPANGQRPKDKIYVFDWVDARIPADYQQDLRGEDGRQPMKIHIDNLNISAMKQWWNGGNNHGKFSAFNNCSDTVCKALQVGGMPMPSHAIHHPEQVHNDANTILNNGWGK